MKYFLMTLFAMVVVLFITINVAPAAESSCFDKVYGSWQAGQQWSDNNRYNFHNDAANRYRNQGGVNSKYLENNARQWSKLYDNARVRSRLYHEFYQAWK